MTDSPTKDKLKFLSEVTVTANHAFIRWHGRDDRHRYNYLYSKEELKPWVGKIKEIQSETAIVRGYFNDHYGAKAIVNAIQFREVIGDAISEKEEKVLEKAQSYWSQQNMKLTSFAE